MSPLRDACPGSPGKAYERVFSCSPHSSGVGVMTSPLRILHLEDDAFDSRLIKGMFNSEGFDAEIKLVDNKKEFVTALEQHRFDLIIADYKLPAFDGMQALI